MFCYGVLCYFALYFEWITIVNIAIRAFYPRGRRGKKSNPELLANRLLIRKHNKDENMNVTNTVLLTFNLFNQIAKKNP